MCPSYLCTRAQHLLAIATHQQPVRLGLHPGRQHRRIRQIGEDDRQPPDLTRIARRGQQVFGLSIRTVSGQHLPRQGRRGRTITAVDRRNRPIQQLVDRRPALRAGIAVARGTVRTVAHLDIVSSPLGAVCCISQAIVHDYGADRSPMRITLHRGSVSSTHWKALTCKQFHRIFTGGVDAFHACGIPANTHHPERFLLDESNNHQLTKVGGCMASAQPVS